SWLPAAAAFVAGLLLGGAAVFALSDYPQFAHSTPPPEALPPSEPAVAAERLLLEALDTADFDENGEPIFDTAAGQWIGDGNRRSQEGDLAGAAENFRKALRKALEENNHQ